MKIPNINAFHLILAIILLMSSGLIFLASAVYPKNYQLLSGHSLWFKQCLYWVVGLMIMFGVTLIPLRVWQRFSYVGIALSLILLVLVLIPHIGTSVKGSSRWLRLPFLNIQVTEIVKLSMIIFMASYISKHHRMLEYHVSSFYKPLVVLAVMSLFILAEPDLGSVVVLVSVSLLMLFISGAPLKYFLSLTGIVVATLTALAFTQPYRIERIKAFLSPWQHKANEGYQIVNAFMAIGHGGLLGVGLGHSIQKQFYLPEAHTDFLFAVMTEEGGLMMAIAFLMLFVFLIMLILQTGRRALAYDDIFGYLLCMGIGFWFSIQGIINVSVNLGLLPTKGITLPFISYGGSSLIISCIAMGLVFRTIKEHNEN
ncbi:MAG: putative lipid II flippase FtsW [Candidatus Comchoanobacterales bacterium]